MLDFLPSSDCFLVLFFAVVQSLNDGVLVIHACGVHVWILVDYFFQWLGWWYGVALVGLWSTTLWGLKSSRLCSWIVASALSIQSVLYLSMISTCSSIQGVVAAVVWYLASSLLAQL
jgi:hypothetical protein